MKPVFKLTKARGRYILHVEIQGEDFYFWYRPGIEFTAEDRCKLKTSSNRFVEDSEKSLIINKRLDRIVSEWENFQITVQNKKGRQPNEKEVKDFFYCCSSLIRNQRVIEVEEFLSWSYPDRRRYYDLNIDGRKVSDWHKVLQNCIERDSQILSSMELYVFALEYKVEILKKKRGVKPFFYPQILCGLSFYLW